MSNVLVQDGHIIGRRIACIPVLHSLYAFQQLR